MVVAVRRRGGVSHSVTRTTGCVDVRTYTRVESGGGVLCWRQGRGRDDLAMPYLARHASVDFD